MPDDDPDLFDASSLQVAQYAYDERHTPDQLERLGIRLALHQPRSATCG
jgi:hypothetical protein